MFTRNSDLVPELCKNKEKGGWEKKKVMARAGTGFQNEPINVVFAW